MPSNSTNPIYLAAREYWNWINANFATLRNRCTNDVELNQLKQTYALAFQNYLEAGKALMPDGNDAKVKAQFQRLVTIKADIDSDIHDLDRITHTLQLFAEAVRIVSVLVA